MKLHILRKTHCCIYIKAHAKSLVTVNDLKDLLLSFKEWIHLFRTEIERIGDKISNSISRGS